MRSDKIRLITGTIEHCTQEEFQIFWIVSNLVRKTSAKYWDQIWEVKFQYFWKGFQNLLNYILYFNKIRISPDANRSKMKKVWLKKLSSISIRNSKSSFSVLKFLSSLYVKENIAVRLFLFWSGAAITFPKYKGLFSSIEMVLLYKRRYKFLWMNELIIEKVLPPFIPSHTTYNK